VPWTPSRACCATPITVTPGEKSKSFEVLEQVVDAVLAECRATQQRLRKLPARVVVYLLLAGCLFAELGYRQVWHKLTAGLAGHGPATAQDLKRWASLTGGDQGMRNVARPEQFSSPTAYYWFTLVVVLICLFLLYRFDKSIVGLRLRGVGDSDKRMSVLGYWVPSYRFLAFNVAGFFATVSGILYVGYFNFIAPTTVHLRGSVEVALMAIIGGATSFSGPIVGAAALLTLRAYLGGLTARWPIVLGVLLIIVVLYARSGIVGALRRLVYGSALGAPAAAALIEETQPDKEAEERVLA
jgi:branched-chain amino acid transport system permease protein